MRKFLAERGYLILAQDHNDQTYITCARALAKSIRWFMPTAKICLVGTSDDPVFDYCLPLPHGDQGFLANDWQLFEISPFRETIKLEADMILNGSIDHWWTILEKKDLVVARGTQDFYGYQSSVKFYRSHFESNQLPDVYNAITYWRWSESAVTFFKTVRSLFENWNQVVLALKGWNQKEPDTDTVYALAMILLGKEKYTLPINFPQFVHMKGKINYCHGQDWTKELVWELNEQGLRINTIQQTIPTHYFIKQFANQLEDHYDTLLGSRS